MDGDIHMETVDGDEVWDVELIKFAEIHGALAHLARAFDWQSRGDRFDPGMLH